MDEATKHEGKVALELRVDVLFVPSLAYIRQKRLHPFAAEARQRPQAPGGAMRMECRAKDGLDVFVDSRKAATILEGRPVRQHVRHSQSSVARSSALFGRLNVGSADELVPLCGLGADELSQIRRRAGQ